MEDDGKRNFQSKKRNDFLYTHALNKVNSNADMQSRYPEQRKIRLAAIRAAQIFVYRCPGQRGVGFIASRNITKFGLSQSKTA